MAKTKTVAPTAELVAEEVKAGQGIKAEQINKLVSDVKAINDELANIQLKEGPQGPKGDTGAQGPAGKDGFGTEAQYNDIIARITALETPAE